MFTLSLSRFAGFFISVIPTFLGGNPAAFVALSIARYINTSRDPRIKEVVAKGKNGIVYYHENR